MSTRRSRPRQMAGLLSAVLILCGPSEAPTSAQTTGAAMTGAVRITAAPVPLNPANPWQTRLGDFVYAGGLVLTAPDTDQLHGLSDLVVDASNHLTAVADTGHLFEARLELDAAGRLAGVSDGRLTALVGLDGALPRQKEDMDAEGLAMLPNGDRLISFEVRDRVWLLDLPLPLTSDNYEGVAAVPRPDGSIRFNLVSDDSARAFQRTLLTAFDWTPQ